MTISTTPLAVKGKAQVSNNFFSTTTSLLPYLLAYGLTLAECSMTTITLDPHATKSIAPPIPFTNFLGMIQFAISQVLLTWSDPKIVKSRCPPLIIENDWEDENRDPPGKIVIVS